MTKDLFNHIQSFFDRGTVIIVGSGLSCSYKYPSMKELSKVIVLFISYLLLRNNKCKHIEERLSIICNYLIEENEHNKISDLKNNIKGILEKIYEYLQYSQNNLQGQENIKNVLQQAYEDLEKALNNIKEIKNNLKKALNSLKGQENINFIEEISKSLQDAQNNLQEQEDFKDFLEKVPKFLQNAQNNLKGSENIDKNLRLFIEYLIKQSNLKKYFVFFENNRNYFIKVLNGLSSNKDSVEKDKILENIINDDNLKDFKVVLESLHKNPDNFEETINQLSDNLNKNEILKTLIITVIYLYISDNDKKVMCRYFANEYKELNYPKALPKFLSKFQLDSYNLPVITTNYDLLLEYSCEFYNIPYIDTFAGKLVSKFDLENSKNELFKGIQNKTYKSIYKNCVELYKPHGSLNWKNIGDKIYKINNLDIGIPHIITPGDSKYLKGYSSPFDYHINMMKEKIDKADRLIFIGYGFNDKHLETSLNSDINKNKPILIITKDLTDNAKKFCKLTEENFKDNVTVIQSYNGETKATKIKQKDFELVIIDKELWQIEELIEEIF